MGDFEVEFFEKSDGTYPAEEFILAQDAKMRAKLLRLISMLEQFGNDLRKPYSELLEDGIFEIRAKQGSDITRVLYFFMTGKKIILTNGFIKKTQKTPPGEIAIAKKYRAEHTERSNQNG